MPYSLAFDRPAYLLLLALIPAMWWLGRRSLAALGRRRWLALGLRSLVAAALALALADAQLERAADGMTVVYLLDQSLSVPAAARQAMLEYVRSSIAAHRQDARGDRFAVIVFGRDAEVELPPVAFNELLGGQIESPLDPEFTDLASAIQRARSIFPSDAAKRIVLVSDGNQNIGDAYREARAAAAAGVGIDVAPVYVEPRSDVAIEKVDVPAGVRRGQPFDLRVVLEHDAADGEDASDSASGAAGGAPIHGRLIITRKTADREQTVADQAVALEPGKRVMTIQQELDEPDFYTYEARFIPDDPAADLTPQNNVASGFAAIRGRGQTLLVENADRRGESDELARRLVGQDIAVTRTTSDQLFNSLAELQRYDAVVLNNVSRTSAGDDDSTSLISDQQIDMLVRNTRELGCGLIMLGGPDTYGAGGWANTKLEEAMPVDFQIKSAKVAPVGALAIVIDRSGSMMGEKLAMSQAAAVAAVRAMGARDYVTVVAFDSAAWTTVPLRRVGNYRAVARAIERLASGGGTDMYPAMVEGFAQLRKGQDAAVKHMIVLTDGQTPDAPFRKLVADLRRQRISVTSVAVGGDANTQLLADIGSLGGGKFYAVTNPRALPRIFLREVRRVSRPLVYETPQPLQPIVESPAHEILRGVEAGVPPVTGFVLTTLKQNPLVERLLRSPQPEKQDNATLLAAWTYGAGKAVALTTDAGGRWAAAWIGWDGYDKFYAQLVRWAMRPTGDAGNLTVAADVRAGVIQVTITAQDEDEQLLNNLAITAAAVAPDLTSAPIEIQQTAPGRYVGQFAAELPGNYLIVVNPGNGDALVRVGANVGYSAEYRDRRTNLALLESLAEIPAAGGTRGEFFTGGLGAGASTAATPAPAPNPFRRDLPQATSRQPIWPWLVVAGTCLFWSDVFVRRVQVSLGWLVEFAARWRNRVLRRAAAATVPETMARLRSRKREIGAQIDDRRATARFETTDSAPAPVAEFLRNSPPPTPPGPTAPPAEQPEAAPPQTYTERLLEAKRRARRDAKG